MIAPNPVFHVKHDRVCRKTTLKFLRFQRPNSGNNRGGNSGETAVEQR